MTVNVTKIIQTASHGFPHCPSQQRSSAEPWEATRSPWDEHPGTHGGSSCCCCCPTADFSAQRHSAGAWASFFGLAFFAFLWHKVRTAPLGQEKGEQRRCHLAVALGKGHRPRGQDLMLPSAASAQQVKSLLPYVWHHLFPCSPSCWQQNLMATFFYLCQIQPWCDVPGTHLSVRGGSCVKHWSPLLAFTGFNRFTRQLNYTPLTSQWKQIFN